MQKIDIYTTPLCGYCHAAKRLLSAKNAPFSEIDVSKDPEKRAEMIRRAPGSRTVPQIFIGDRHVGGFDEIKTLDGAGKLDPLLAG